MLKPGGSWIFSGCNGALRQAELRVRLKRMAISSRQQD
jgi:hypothetical protein